MTKTNQVLYKTRAIEKLKEHNRNITILGIDSGTEMGDTKLLFTIQYTKGRNKQIFTEKVEINTWQDFRYVI